MISEQDREMAQVAGLERLQGFMPYLEAEIEVIKRAIVVRAQTAQTAGALTPALAQALWADYLAANSLLRRMGQKTRSSVSIGERLSSLLTGPAASE